jgi:hypothetical protein
METSYTGPRRGSDNSQSKLQAYQVLEIRAKSAAGTTTQAQLSRDYGVGAGRISDIVNRKLWKHI